MEATGATFIAVENPSNIRMIWRERCRKAPSENIVATIHVLIAATYEERE